MVHKRFRKHPRTAALAAAAVLVLAPAAAGCGDGGGDAQQSPATASPQDTRATSPQATGDRNQPADPAAARQEIEKAWTTFFDPNASTDAKVRALENGDALRPVLAAFSGDPNAARTSAEVTNVTFTSATRADVTYDLLIDGNPVLTDSKGTAVHQKDAWKVSAKTFCALVKLSPDASAAPGC
ncbi:hypothetical protein [Streptomyces sp. NPDC006368]|uniref:hypothetical protein n=1 Tax=Streptomyces sp. NPDC006368 TaxID=3156760 RepID=UPI0033B7B8CF